MFALLRHVIRPAELTDRAGPPAPPDRREVRAKLRRIAAEALICSDRAEGLIRGIRARESLGVIAPSAGPLIRRFFALRDLLPVCPHPRDGQLRSGLDSILHHHAMLLAMAMDFAACEWRSERLTAQIDALDGMGEPASWLEEIYAELALEPAAENRRVISA